MKSANCSFSIACLLAATRTTNERPSVTMPAFTSIVELLEIFTRTPCANGITAHARSESQMTYWNSNAWFESEAVTDASKLTIRREQMALPKDQTVRRQARVLIVCEMISDVRGDRRGPSARGL